MAFIGGSSYSRFILRRSGRADIIVNVPLCMEGGMVSGHDVYDNQEEAISLSDANSRTIIPDPKGIRKTFSFDYNSYIDGTDLANTWAKIIEAYMSNLYTLILYPRVDGDTSYEVVLTSTNFNIGIMRGGTRAAGNKLFNIQFATKDLVTSLNWRVVTTVYHAVDVDEVAAH